MLADSCLSTRGWPDRRALKAAMSSSLWRNSRRERRSRMRDGWGEHLVSRSTWGRRRPRRRPSPGWSQRSWKGIHSGSLGWLTPRPSTQWGSGLAPSAKPALRARRKTLVGNPSVSDSCRVMSEIQGNADHLPGLGRRVPSRAHSVHIRISPPATSERPCNFIPVEPYAAPAGPKGGAHASESRTQAGQMPSI